MSHCRCMTEPPPDDDNLGWDVDRDGRMIDYAAAPEDELVTEPYDPDRDPVNKGEA